MIDFSPTPWVSTWNSSLCVRRSNVDWAYRGSPCGSWGTYDSPRLITVRTHVDHTDLMLTWAKKRVKELEKEDLCGFIFKSDSPSSGMERVKVYNETGMPEKKGVGLFARAFMDHFPLIPVEEEGRLHDPKLRENFIERIFTLKRWREFRRQKAGLGGLVDFHTRNKLLVLAHSEKHHRAMGKLVAAGKTIPVHSLYDQYEALLMEALSLKTTVKKNANVLYHLMGYFKNDLSADEKQELTGDLRPVPRRVYSPHRACDSYQSLCQEVPGALPGQTDLPESPSCRSPVAESCLEIREIGGKEQG